MLRLKHEPTDALVDELNQEFSDILASGRIQKVGPSAAELADDDNIALSRVQLAFNRRSLGRLRLMVDRLNDAAEMEEAQKA